MIKVYVDYTNYNCECRLWIVDDFGNGRRILNYVNDQWIATELKEGDFAEKPSLNLPGRFSNEFMQAIVEAFTARGIKTENDHKIQGKLDATLYHLEDLRSLLKLKKRGAA